MDVAQLNIIKDTVLEQTPQARKIIAVLNDVADWMTQDEVASALSKNRLTPHDIGLLERLAATGLVEIKKRDRPGRIGFEFINRLDAKVHRGLNRLHHLRRVKSSN